MASTIAQKYIDNPLTTLQDDAGFPVLDDMGGTPAPGVITKDDLLRQFILNANYKIAPSVASNNLTVAIQNLDDDDFDAADPLKILLSDEMVEISSALSVTKNAGTNWANLGSSELADLEVDLFVYLINETGASAGIKAGWSRIPDGTVAGDFSSTTTNEKYLAGPTNYNATDEVQLIGRFNAVLSDAGAGYTWSLPATQIIINYPIDRTRWLNWTPTFTGFSADPTDNWFQYRISRGWLEMTGSSTTSGTSNATSFTISMPFTSKTITDGVWVGTMRAVDNGSTLAIPGFARVGSAASAVQLGKDWSSLTGWTGSGGKRAAGFNVSCQI